MARRAFLLYRGYPIDQLAKNSNFLEVCYLLLYGELPTPKQMADFDHTITYHTMVHEQLSFLFRGFRRDAHPMAVMVGVVGALSAFYHDSTDITDKHQREVASHRLIAKIPTIAAMAYKYSIGQPFVYPLNHLGYTENFMRMCFAVPCEEYKVNPVLAKALDTIFILHADHEQNASTSTVRLAGSSGANPFACIAAGIACLWGPAHGGANEAALKMLQEIGSVDRVPEYVKQAKDKNDSFRLMGFGHRVYKNYDPRAKVMRDQCYAVLDALGKHDDPLLKTALELERIALQDDYFIEKKLYPEHRFLFGHHPESAGFPDRHVHRPVRARKNGRLGRAMAGNDRGRAAEDRPSASALYGPPAAGLCSSGETPRLKRTDATGRRPARSIGVRRPDGTDRSPARHASPRRAGRERQSFNPRNLAACCCRQHGRSVRGKPHSRGTGLHRPRRHHRKLKNGE